MLNMPLLRKDVDGVVKTVNGVDEKMGSPVISARSPKMGCVGFDTSHERKRALLAKSAFVEILFSISSRKPLNQPCSASGANAAKSSV